MITVSIESRLSIEAIDRIVDYVITYLSRTDRDCISDIDEEMEGVRICVDFKIIFDIDIHEAVLLDEEGEEMRVESALFAEKLDKELESFNREEKILHLQAMGILEDQRNYIPY